MPDPLLLIGDAASDARESARRAGYEPFELLGEEALRRLREAPADAPVLFTGAMENRPDIMRAIAGERRLLGSPPAAVEAARRPEALSGLPPFPGLRFPKTKPRIGVFERVVRRIVPGRIGSLYLVKPLASFGGRGISPWSRRARVPAGSYLQQAVEGTPMSAVFQSREGWSCVLVGVTEQLVGEPRLGPGWYSWCGSIGPVALSTRERDALSHLGVVLAQRHDLRGLFGVDLIRDRSGDWWPVEVNPRYVASADVLERAASGQSLLTGRPAVPNGGMQHGLAVKHDPAHPAGRGQRFTASGPDRATCFAALLAAAQAAETSADDDAPDAPDEPGTPDRPDASLTPG